MADPVKAGGAAMVAWLNEVPGAEPLNAEDAQAIEDAFISYIPRHSEGDGVMTQLTIHPTDAEIDVTEKRHLNDGICPTWPQIRMLHAAARDRNRLEAEVERLSKLVYVPGAWKCPKCQFQLMQATLYAQSGTVGPNDKPGEKCPNCNGPLWRVTERDAGNEMVDRCEEQVLRARAAEAENAKLREALKPLAKAAGQTPIMVGRGENTRPHTPLDSAAFENWSGAVTWGMLRAARRALSQLETDNG